MSDENWLTCHADEKLLIEKLCAFASRFLVGKLERWSKVYLVAQFIFFGVLGGWVSLVISIAIDMSPLFVVSSALFGTMFTVALPVGWVMVNRMAPEMEDQLASWLESRSHQFLEEF